MDYRVGGTMGDFEGKCILGNCLCCETSQDRKTVSFAYI
jgi:hypothetical protein